MEGSDAGRSRRLPRGGPRAAGPDPDNPSVIHVSVLGDGEDADVISGGPAPPPRRPVVAGLAVAAVVAAAVLGYLAGERRHAVPVATPSTAGSLVRTPVVGTGATCAVQLGSRLQLGVEIVNRSPAGVTLSGIGPYLPLPGLRAVATSWGGCGQLAPENGRDRHELPAGGTTWLTVTFDVLVSCPAPDPVGFDLRYERAGFVEETRVMSFPDLGDVTYDRCPATPG